MFRAARRRARPRPAAGARGAPTPAAALARQDVLAIGPRDLHLRREVMGPRHAPSKAAETLGAGAAREPLADRHEAVLLLKLRLHRGL